MPPKRSTTKAQMPAPTTISRAGHVRNLWSEFEVWHAEQRAQLDQRIEEALRDLDSKWQKSATGNKKRKNTKKDPEHEKRRAEKREEMEKSFDGNKVREEWQNRLLKAGLNDHDWNDMTPNEQKKVEKILGVGLEEETSTVIEAAPPAPPPAPVQQKSQPSPPLAQSLTSESRSDSMSDTFAFVDPTTFSVSHVEDESSLDNWLEVRQRIKSDDEISLDASTTSSWVGGLEAPAYMGWFSESRSSAQSSQTSLSGSPERGASKLPALEPFNPNLLSSAVTRLSSSTDRLWDGDKSDFLADSIHSDPISAVLASSRGDRMSTHSGKRKSQNRYIGPQLVDPDDQLDEAEQFENYKRMVRVQIIKEFHQEAADADINLFLTIEEAIQLKIATGGFISKKVEEHEDWMLQLRQRKEEERKRIVETERQRRLAEWNQRGQRQQPATAPQPAPVPASTSRQPPPLPDEKSLNELGIDTDILTEKFLRELSFGPEGSSSAVSETPTVRSQLNRGARPPNIQDWLAAATSESGTDTPTPTLRASAWTTKDSIMGGKPVDPSALTDAPAFKRLPSGLSNALTSNDLDTQFDSTALETPVSKTRSKKSNAQKAKDSKTKGAETSGKGKTESATNNKIKMAEPVVTQTEGASSSKTKLEQLPQPASKAQSAWEPVKAEASSSKIASTSLSQSQLSATSPRISLPPPVPLATRPDIPATFATPTTTSILSPPATKPAATLPLPTPIMQTQTLAPPMPIPSSSSGQSTSSKTAKPQVLTQTQTQTQMYHSQPAPQPQSQPQPVSVPVSAPPADIHHQRWIPPTTETKRPQPARTVTEPPSKLKKSQTLPQTQTQEGVKPAVPAPPPTTTNTEVLPRRSRRMSDPVSPSPRSFDYPNGKVPGKATADPGPVPVPSGILKKPSTSGSGSGSSSSKVTAKKSSSAKGKKVTIEEIKDEQEEKEEKTEHLPTDSRYIMEPKPVVASGMFNSIFDYEGELEKTKAKEKESAKKAKGKESVLLTSTSSVSHAQSNQMWIPPQSSQPQQQQQQQAPVQKTVQFPQEEERHVRWTPNVAMLGEDSLAPGSAPERDTFLSGLDTLQKLMEDSGMFSDMDDKEARELDRLLSKDSKKKVEKKTEKKPEKEKVQSGMFWTPQGSGPLRMPGGF
ncbi:hypothetical protein WG66_009453 [Moniliophthora roreri]|nr:hypothetical protein WG66_009453 [Moniliophthora roreri]